MSPARTQTRRQRTTLSMDAVMTEAVALLDEAGESALTFRALAMRLGGGVASIYWYVDSKEELLDRATDHVMAEVLALLKKKRDTDDPIADMRRDAITLFDAIVRRPWLAAYFMRNTDVQGSSLGLYEHLGQRTMRLDLTPRQRFHAVSAVVGFVVGIAADLGKEPPAEVLDGTTSRDEFLSQWAERWRELDAEEYPFVRDIVDEFEHHDDRDQFLAGLDLTLDGLRLQAGSKKRR